MTTNTTVTAAASGADSPSPVDLLGIVDALYRFGAGQDLDDRGLFKSAFAKDAVLDFVQPAERFGLTLQPFVGRDDIAETVFGTLALLRTTHTVTNPRAVVDGDRAKLFALVEAQHVPNDDASRHLLLKNIYGVELVRDADRWLITHLKIDNVWYSGDPAVLFPSAA